MKKLKIFENLPEFLIQKFRDSRDVKDVQKRRRFLAIIELPEHKDF